MSTASTLYQARDFLLLAPDAPAAEVLQAAHERHAEWKTKLDDPKAPARLKDGASKKLRTLAPMLPFLETEVLLEESARSAKDPLIGKNQLMRLCDNVAQKIVTLPDGEEKAMLLCRVEDIRAAAVPIVPPPPKEINLPPDPSLPVFEAKLADLRAAIDREDTNKLSLARLLAEANKAMSRLRDQPDRAHAETEIEKLEREAEALFIKNTLPPVDFAKIVTDRLALAAATLERGDLATTPELLVKAAELLPILSDDALKRATAQHAALTERHRQLVAAAAADAAARKLFSEKLPALTAAIALPDLLRAGALLAELRGAPAAIRDAAARAAAESKLAELVAQLQKLEREAAEQAAKKKDCAARLIQLGGLLDRSELAPAQKLLDEICAIAGTLSDLAARNSVLAGLEPLAARLKELNKPAPPLPTGQLLRLTPRDGVVIAGYVPVPLRLVARPRLVVGRFSAEGSTRADFLVPLSEKRVSRAHVVLSLKGEEILIQDGDEGKNSSNGSKLDDEALPAAPVPASFSHERIISLGGIFSLTAQHLPTQAPGGPPKIGAVAQSADGKKVIINAVTGCMRFAAKTDAHLPVQTAWIFTDASLGTAPANALALPHSGLSETHVRVHFAQGAFWLETLHADNAVRLGARVLAKGAASPLRTGDILHLGQLAYDVAVEE